MNSHILKWIHYKRGVQEIVIFKWIHYHDWPLYLKSKRIRIDLEVGTCFTAHYNERSLLILLFKGVKFDWHIQKISPTAVHYFWITGSWLWGDHTLVLLTVSVFPLSLPLLLSIRSMPSKAVRSTRRANSSSSWPTWSRTTGGTEDPELPLPTGHNAGKRHAVYE